MSIRLLLALAALFAATPVAAQSPGPGAPDTSAAPAPDASTLQAQLLAPTPPDFPRGRISGTIFGDVYYNAAGDPMHAYSPSGADLGQANIDAVKPITRDLNGTQVRRVYFQLDNDLTIRYATRLRLEIDGKALSSDGKIAPFVKNAYVLARSVVPRGDFSFGMLSTPTWEGAEELWGYRAIEKTIADFHGLSSASDLGVELKGFFDGDHRAGYAAMIGDGNGQKPETDRFKKFYLGLPARFGELRIEPYADFQAARVNLQPKDPAHTDSLAAHYDQTTWKLFAGYEFHRVAVGAEGLVRLNRRASAPSTEPRGLSLFARGPVTPGLAAFVRVDHWASDVRASDRVDTRLWIAGVDWQPVRDVHVMPNVEAVEYLAQGAAVAPPHHDVQLRVTFHYKFSKPQS